MKRILIAPLDWGLGHATRCIPVIREFLQRGCDVLIAGSGDSLELLRKEFPDLRFFLLPGYEPRYPTSGSMAWTMSRQLPRFMRVIFSEHRAIEKIIDREKIDCVISDNRYGCWSKKIPTVFITHQSNILMPKRFGWMQSIIAALNKRFINRFSVCWVPDFPGHHSLAGDLIASGKFDVKTGLEYIGWLSRFTARENNRTERYDVVAVFSGPEPQRTLLENIVAPQIKDSGLTYRIVRGLPFATTSPNDGSIVNFLTSDELQASIESAKLVIARSGYSTVMDLNALAKKVLFIPTPGQTEQEYLARRLMEKGIAFSMPQHAFHLATAIKESENYSGFKCPDQNVLLRIAIDKLVADNP